MHDYSFKIQLHSHVRKDKKQLLYFVAHINKQRVRLKMGVAVESKYFSKSKQNVSKRCPESDLINATIEKYKTSANELFMKARVFSRPLTGERFEYLLLNEALSKDFIAYFDEAMKEESKTLSLSTAKKYRTVLNLLKQFSKRIDFYEIDAIWLTKFDRFIKQQTVKSGKNKGKKYAANTVTAIHTKVKKFLKLAIVDLNLNIENPYDTFQLKWLQSDRVFLTPVELEKFVKLYDNRDKIDLPLHLVDTLQMFLFMCGSGLRISDSGRLTGLHIVDDSIKIRTQKNKKFRLASTFPLSQFSKKYLPEDTNGKLFKYGNSQKLNRNLKVICEYLEIGKDVTSHSARHTFATNFILSGGQVAVLKELLGHSDIKTTMIYVHITKDVERKALKVFDSFLDF